MTTQQLGGEADPNVWDFVAPHGPLPNPVGHTFPLLSHDGAGIWRLIGTGFYVSADGLFVTAKHVIEDVWLNNEQVSPLAIMHLHSRSGLFGAEEYLLRPVTQCWLGDAADIALGVAARATNNATSEVLSHWRWPLSWTAPEVGTKTATYAFPNHSIENSGARQVFHFHPDLYLGTVREVGNFRDRVLVPYPYMHVDFRIHRAASGGPVVGADGTVIGVNCREMDPAGPGVVAQIRCLQDAYIDDALLEGEGEVRRVTFSELATAGVVAVNGYAADTVPAQPGRTVRLGAPITARGPALELSIYS
jgi:hypothetical protein